MPSRHEELGTGRCQTRTCEWVTNIDFYENDLLRTLGIAVHNLLRLQKPEAIAYTACYPRDVAGRAAISY
jgi:hypothetical protein